MRVSVVSPVCKDLLGVNLSKKFFWQAQVVQIRTRDLNKAVAPNLGRDEKMLLFVAVENGTSSGFPAFALKPAIRMFK